MNDTIALPNHCRNCDAFLGDPPGKFCPQCGQDTANHAPSFWEFFHEFITHYVALEGKLWRTLVLLFFKPAELSREYRMGRKQRYISPLRLYITASFLFFLVIKIAGWGNTIIIESNVDHNPAKVAKQARGITYSFTTDKPPADMTLDDLKEMKELQDLKPDGKADIGCAPDSPLCTKLQDHLQKKYKGKTGKDVMDMVMAGVLANIPYAMFLLLPLFAMLTKLIYVNRGLYFGEHVVYALHVHSFTFFALLLKSTLPRYAGDAVMIAALVYYFVAMQRFFGGRWWATTLRYAVVATVYPILLSLVTTVVVLFVLVA